MARTIIKRFAGKAMVVAMAFALFLTSARASDSGGKTHIVEISGFKFVPESVEIRPGDTVTWVNKDIAPHTATAADGNWDTGTLGQNKSRSLVFNTEMSADYLCLFHVAMTGSVKQSTKGTKGTKGTSVN